MKMNLSSIWLFSFALGASGCATTYKDFKASQVKPDQGVAIGKVIIKYNGQKLNKDCAVCFNSVNGPCQKLTDEGWVVQNIKTGPSTLRRITCTDKSVQHYNIEGATFTQHDGVTYFGDVTFEWTNSGGIKASSMFGLVGAMVSESSNDGTITMSVSSEGRRGVTQIYEDLAQQQKEIKPTQDLVRIGK